MKYVYPVIFYKDEKKIGVTVPDIFGCHTFGKNMAEAIEMAQDVIEMILVSYENDNQEIPQASDIDSIKKDSDTIAVSLVVADTDKWRQENDNKAVKKTLSIPSWMNKKAEAKGINFSQCLQDALRAQFE